MSPAIRSTLLALAAAAGGLATLPALAGLTATVSTDIPAARNTFLAQSAVLGAYDWGSLPSHGNYSLGSLGTMISYASLQFLDTNGAVNSVLGVNPGRPLAIANWVDGPGFDSPAGQAAADLALNGTESFDLVFGAPYLSVGLAVVSGKSNLSSEIDLQGASFEFTVLDASNQAIGTASLVLPGGGAAAAWVTLVSSAPILGLQVRETNAANANDQYFSNILATPAVVSTVPEPGAWLLMGLGLAGLGLARRRGRSQARSQ